MSVDDRSIVCTLCGGWVEIWEDGSKHCDTCSGGKYSDEFSDSEYERYDTEKIPVVPSMYERMRPMTGEQVTCLMRDYKTVCNNLVRSQNALKMAMSSIKRYSTQSDIPNYNVENSALWEAMKDCL